MILSCFFYLLQEVYVFYSSKFVCSHDNSIIIIIIIIIIIVGYDLVRAVDSFIFSRLISRFRPTLILSTGAVFSLSHSLSGFYRSSYIVCFDW